MVASITRSFAPRNAIFFCNAVSPRCRSAGCGSCPCGSCSGASGGARGGGETCGWRTTIRGRPRLQPTTLRGPTPCRDARRGTRAPWQATPARGTGDLGPLPCECPILGRKAFRVNAAASDYRVLDRLYAAGLHTVARGLCRELLLALFAILKQEIGLGIARGHGGIAVRSTLHRAAPNGTRAVDVAPNSAGSDGTAGDGHGTHVVRERDRAVRACERAVLAAREAALDAGATVGARLSDCGQAATVGSTDLGAELDVEPAAVRIDLARQADGAGPPEGRRL